MEKMATLSNDLVKYLKEIECQSKTKQIEGYFPVDAVIDAFTKGEISGAEKARKDFKDLRNSFVRKSTQMFLYGNDLLKNMEEKGHNISGFYINPFHFKIIFTTPIENTYNEDFIDDFYEQSYSFQDKFKDEFKSGIHFMFMKNVDINEGELAIDGFVKVDNNEA